MTQKIKMATSKSRIIWMTWDKCRSKVRVNSSKTCWAIFWKADLAFFQERFSLVCTQWHQNSRWRPRHVSLPSLQLIVVKLFELSPGKQNWSLWPWKSIWMSDFLHVCVQHNVPLHVLLTCPGHVFEGIRYVRMGLWWAHPFHWSRLSPCFFSIIEFCKKWLNIDYRGTIEHIYLFHLNYIALYPQ